MTYRSDDNTKFFPNSTPTGWNQRNMQMPNRRWQIQRQQKRG